MDRYAQRINVFVEGGAIQEIETSDDSIEICVMDKDNGDTYPVRFPVTAMSKKDMVLPNEPETQELPIDGDET